MPGGSVLQNCPQEKMLSRRNKYFLDFFHSQEKLNRFWHHLLEKIRSVLHKGIRNWWHP